MTKFLESRRKKIREHIGKTPPILEFRAMGKPIAKARPRGSFAGKKSHFYTEKSTMFWEMYTRLSASAIVEKDDRFPLTGPLALSVGFVFSRPKSLSVNQKNKLQTSKPDMKNLIGAVEDGMEGVVFDNDSHIVYYEEPIKTFGDKPMAEIRIWLLPWDILKGCEE